MNLVNNSEIENSGHSESSETTYLVKFTKTVILVNLEVAIIVVAALPEILYCCNVFMGLSEKPQQQQQNPATLKHKELLVDMTR